MSIECSICERDLRGGHAPTCPRAVDPDSVLKDVKVGDTVRLWEGGERLLETQAEVDELKECIMSRKKKRKVRVKPELKIDVPPGGILR